MTVNSMPIGVGFPTQSETRITTLEYVMKNQLLQVDGRVRKLTGTDKESH